jgi:hypothetical protein
MISFPTVENFGGPVKRYQPILKYLNPTNIMPRLTPFSQGGCALLFEGFTAIEIAVVSEVVVD